MPNEFVEGGQETSQDAALDELAAELSGEDHPEEPSDIEETPEDSNEETGTEEGIEETPEVPEEGTEEEGDAPEVGEEPEGKTKGVPKDTEKDHLAFANMRAELNQYKTALEKMALKNETDVEGLLEQMEREEMEAEAAAQNIPFEVYERLRHLEEVNEERERETQALQFRYNLEKFQTSHELDKDEMRSFIDTCFEHGIDVSQTDIDLSVLYKGLNYDTLLESERQKWISKDESNRSSSSAPSSGRGKTPQSGTQKIETMEDLDAAFSQIKL